MKWTSIAGVLGAITLIAGVAGIFGVDNFRFWAWASDVQVVAGDSYSSQIVQLSAILTLATQQRAQCLATGGDCTLIVAQVASLEQRLRDLLAKKAQYGG